MAERQKWSAWEHQWVAAVYIYHFLSRAFSQSVSIAEIVDLDVANIISILCVYLLVKTIWPGGRGFGASWALSLKVKVSKWLHMRDRKHMFQRTERIGGTSTC